MLRRVFKAFHYRDFRLLWIGACTSSIGTWMQIVAQSWLVLEISKSPRMLGLDAFLGNIPIFLFSLVGGVVADRLSRRRLLLASQWVQLTCAFTLAALIATGVVRIWHILTPVVHRGDGAILWRPGVFGADALRWSRRRTCPTPSR